MKSTLEQLSNDIRKEYLNGYRKYKKKIKSLTDQRISLINEMESAKSQIISDMPKGKQKGDLSDYIIRMEDLENEIKKVLYNKEKRKIDIERKIMGIEDGDESDVLRLRYIELYSWEEICLKIGYSWKQTHRIHGRALQNFTLNQDDIE